MSTQTTEVVDLPAVLAAMGRGEDPLGDNKLQIDDETLGLAVRIEDVLSEVYNGFFKKMVADLIIVLKNAIAEHDDPILAIEAWIDASLQEADPGRKRQKS